MYYFAYLIADCRKVSQSKFLFRIANSSESFHHLEIGQQSTTRIDTGIIHRMFLINVNYDVINHWNLLTFPLSDRFGAGKGIKDFDKFPLWLDVCFCFLRKWQLEVLHSRGHTQTTQAVVIIITWRLYWSCLQQTSSTYNLNELAPFITNILAFFVRITGNY